MARSKTTKRALVASAFAMLMCIAMLIGTTFAWFTDTASISVNKIQSGTLDIALQMNTGTTTEPTWVSAEGQTLNFKKASTAPTEEPVLWEPGCTYELPQLKIVNNGSLALKYKVKFSATNTDAENLKLAKVLDVTMKIGDGEEQPAGTLYDVLTSTDEDGYAHGNLTAKDTDGADSGAITLKVKMHETAGNEYQDKSIEGIAVTVYATQNTVEYDSTENQYDAAAEYATPVTTSDELVAAITDGEDVVLKNDVTLPENTTLAITKSVTIYGDGTTSLKWTGSQTAGRVINIESPTNPGDLKDITLTLSGVDIVGPTDNSYNRGVSAWGIENLTIIMDNCSASANHYALNIAAKNTNVKIVIRNTTLTGYSAFQTWSAGTNATFENCTLIGVNQWGVGSNDYATIVICADSYDAAKNCTLAFKNCRIEANTTHSNPAKEYFLRTDTTEAKVTFDGCKFFVNDTEVTGNDITDNMKIQSDTQLTIQ